MNYEQASREWWIFFDWKDGLHREVAFHGVTIFAFKETYELAQLLNKENEVAPLPSLIRKMKRQPANISTILKRVCSQGY